MTDILLYIEALNLFHTLQAELPETGIIETTVSNTSVSPLLINDISKFVEIVWLILNSHLDSSVLRVFVLTRYSYIEFCASFVVYYKTKYVSDNHLSETTLNLFIFQARDVVTRIRKLNKLHGTIFVTATTATATTTT